MGICCSKGEVHSDEQPAFTNEDPPVPVVSESEKSFGTHFENVHKPQDGTPLLKTTEMKMMTISDDSSDMSFDQDVIDKMLAEVSASESD